MRLRLSAAKPKSSKLKLVPTKPQHKKRPRKDFTGGAMSEFDAELRQCLENISALLIQLESQPETPEDSVRYERAFDTRIELQEMLEGREHLDQQRIQNILETYSTPE